jgi:hypothetical protein
MLRNLGKASSPDAGDCRRRPAFLKHGLNGIE